MSEYLVTFFLVSGAFFMLIAGVGILRMPDLMMRMHSSTKSGALGVSLIMIGVGLHFMDAHVWTRSIAIIVFIMITSPIAAHVIGRAGYFVGAALCDQTIKDELKDCYDQKTHVLRSEPKNSKS